MRGELLFDEPGATTRSVSSPPTLSLLAAALTTLTCGALCAVAIVAHAPEVVVPLVVAICIGCPVVASWHVPGTLAVVRRHRRAARAVAQMRKGLGQLPDAEHPLGADG